MKNVALSHVYANAFSKTNNLVYLLDKDGFLMDCNDNLLKFLGFNSNPTHSQDSIYDLMRKQGLWTLEQLKQFKQKDIGVLISGNKTIDQQALISSNGSIHYFEFSRTPFTDSSGLVLGLLVTIRDLTKQKKLEDQLKNLKTQAKYNNLSEGMTTDNPRPFDKIRILLVEDNVLSQKAEKKILMACNCVVDVVATSKHADELYNPGKYQMVLMDLTLEEGDGYHLTIALRKKEQASSFRAPIIALTGHDPTEVKFNCEDSKWTGSFANR